MASVLGSWRIPETIPDLVAALDFEVTLHGFHVRAAALRALGRIGVMVPELRPEDADSAWAWWRCGGDAEQAAAVIGSGRMTWPQVARLAELGATARPYVDRLPLDDPDARMRVLTRYARWRATGESGDLVPVCLEVLDGMERGVTQSGMCEAIRALRELGVRPEWVDAALASGHRFDIAYGWAAFDHDLDVRRQLSLL
jgi:hypothetical protein